MAAPDEAFAAALGPVLSDLSAELGLGPFTWEETREEDRVRLVGGSFRVPARYVRHHERFGSLPTDLARELAEAAHARARPEADEADRLLFVEVFLRGHVLNREV